MKALVLEAPGDEPSLALRDVAVPTAGPHDVLVEVAACGLCHHDVAVMQGLLRRGVKQGIILGHEISGRVAEIGDSVSSVEVGESVVSTLTTFCGECQRCLHGMEYRCLNGRGIGHSIDGGFAQLVCLPESSVVPVPAAADLELASVYACPMGVALRALQAVAEVGPDNTVLVTGAGGGLGVHSMEIAAALGARVLAVTTSPAKAERLEAMGRAEVIVHGDLDFSEIALALTEDRGVDVVIDTVGSALFQSSLKSVTQFGMMVLLGEVAGGEARVNPAEIIFRDATIVGSSGADRRHIATVAEMVGSGAIRPVVSQRFALEDSADAYRLMRARKTFGRVVLIPPATS